MKECSKIWAKYKIPGDGIPERATFYQGWHAALEWALTNEQSVSGLLPDIRVAVVASLDIRRELKETDSERV